MASGSARWSAVALAAVLVAHSWMLVAHSSASGSALHEQMCCPQDVPDSGGADVVHGIGVAGLAAADQEDRGLAHLALLCVVTLVGLVAVAVAAASLRGTRAAALDPPPYAAVRLRLRRPARPPPHPVAAGVLLRI